MVRDPTYGVSVIQSPVRDGGPAASDFTPGGDGRSLLWLQFYSGKVAPDLSKAQTLTTSKIYLSDY